jgi:hypothetical protein
MKTLFFASTLMLISGLVFADDTLKNLSDEQLKAELHIRTGEGYKSLNYKNARVQLFNHLFIEKDETGFYNVDVYCEKRFDRKFKGDTVTNELPDANLFNTEHTWPQSKFNETIDEEVQKTDLHHLYPTYNKINAERGNLPYANIGAESPKKLFCDLSKLGEPVGFAKGTYFEPPTAHKGNVARSMFYFSVRYEMKIDAVEEIFLKFWHMLDPVDAKEKARNDMIQKVQNNRNPFVDEPELVLQISDF